MDGPVHPENVELLDDHLEDLADMKEKDNKPDVATAPPQILDAPTLREYLRTRDADELTSEADNDEQGTVFAPHFTVKLKANTRRDGKPSSKSKVPMTAFKSYRPTLPLAKVAKPEMVHVGQLTTTGTTSSWDARKQTFPDCIMREFKLKFPKFPTTSEAKVNESTRGMWQATIS